MIKKLLLWLSVSAIVLSGCSSTGTHIHNPVILDMTKLEIKKEKLSPIEKVVKAAMQKGDIPGAVVLVGQHDDILYHKAFGYSQIIPTRKPMQPNMMFDMASITKPVATATSIMILVERGELRLTDLVSDYLPEFSRFEYPDSSLAPEAKIWHLLTHTAGIFPYGNVDSAAVKLGRPCTNEAMAKYIAHFPKKYPPGDEYVYSCLGYITLAYIIEKVSGKNVDEFSRENIFKPLRMNHSTYTPDSTCLPLCVPTEVKNGIPFHGIVHDPMARLQGGISGNAGLYSTAQDLSRYARMMLHGGELDGVRILSPLTVKRMIEIIPSEADCARGYGWGVRRGQSFAGGDILPDGSFGHTGYTGTSLWIDPHTGIYIITLTNRVHPKDDGQASWLRSSIANIVAAAAQ